MHIVHIAAEMAGFVKVGGLGDMIAGLTKQISANGHDVTVIIPRHKKIKQKNLHEESFAINHLSFKAQSCFLENVQVIMIDPAPMLDYYIRPNVYGYEDDPIRFIYLCKAALEYLSKKHKPIDILHLHDWHTSMAAFLYKEFYQKKTLQIKKIVLNIHNVGYQGMCHPAELKKIDISPKPYMTKDKLKDLNQNKLNPLKAGVIYSDQIVAVSKSYAQSILTSMGSKNLQPVFQKYQYKLTGILNGIDYGIWNPETDVGIIENYSSNDPFSKIQKAKKQSKDFLQARFNLKKENVPLVINIGRLVRQKGPKSLLFTADYTIKKNGQFILLGSSLLKTIQRQFTAKQKSTEKTQQTTFIFEFNESLSHILYAGADFIVIPSIFEPCGLTQMLALRYGTVPIVRRTGGLKDTVIENVNGFPYDPFDKNGLKKALDKAFDMYQNDKKRFGQIIKAGMYADHSLEKTTQEYLKLYQTLLEGEKSCIKSAEKKIKKLKKVS